MTAYYNGQSRTPVPTVYDLVRTNPILCVKTGGEPLPYGYCYDSLKPCRAGYANPIPTSSGWVLRAQHDHQKEKPHLLVCTGISPSANIPSPCAGGASSPIFGRGMRTRSRLCRGGFFVRSTITKKKNHTFWCGFLFGDPYGNRTHVSSVRG